MSGKRNKEPSPLVVRSSAPVRLDRFLADQYPDYSRMFFKRLIESGAVSVDGRTSTAKRVLKLGQHVAVRWPEPKKTGRPDKTAGDLPFPVLYEDEDLFCINKPAGLLVHPTSRWNREKTLVDYIEPKLSSFDWPESVRPGLVHRLDRDTSGLLILAKTPSVHANLSRQFAARTVKKSYATLVHGVPDRIEGAIEGRLSRDPRHRKKFRISGEGRMAVTKFRVEEKFAQAASLLTVFPRTGRTHQIRVHLSAIGHPIIGDTVYGPLQKKYDFVRRQLLHAWTLDFIHPRAKKTVRLTAPWPEDFQTALKNLRLRNE